MLAKMVSATFDTETGRVVVILDTSTTTGYPNSCEQFSSYGFMSVPLPGQLVEISEQSLIQVQVNGYNCQINDTFFNINPGEATNYGGGNWYNTNAITGVYIQQAHSANAENQMMGQSTNSVIADILNYLIDLESYLNTHVHDGVSMGTDTSGPPSSSPPDPSPISTDLTYISDNKNLAITGTYTPKLSLSAIFERLRGLA